MKRINPLLAGVLAAVIPLAACVMPPLGPSIAVMPGPSKSFDAFSADQAVCQQYAAAQTGPAAAAASNQAIGGAILSTALGAGLGAAIGGGRGAAIGAASGAALGGVVGASGAGYAQMSLQQQYDVMYGQCMAARGDQVPGFSPPPMHRAISAAPVRHRLMARRHIPARRFRRRPATELGNGGARQRMTPAERSLAASRGREQISSKVT